MGPATQKREHENEREQETAHRTSRAPRGLEGGFVCENDGGYQNKIIFA